MILAKVLWYLVVVYVSIIPISLAWLIYLFEFAGEIDPDNEDV